MSQEQIAEIELNIKHAKELVALGRSLERLMTNRDFKKVFLEGYLKEEAVRLVHLKADANFQDAENQKSILQQIDAIGSVTHYLTALRHQGMLAEKAIEADEEALDELRGEDAE